MGKTPPALLMEFEQLMNTPLENTAATKSSKKGKKGGGAGLRDDVLELAGKDKLRSKKDSKRGHKHKKERKHKRPRKEPGS